jgi:aminopeptidase C
MVWFLKLYGVKQFKMSYRFLAFFSDLNITNYYDNQVIIPLDYT